MHITYLFHNISKLHDSHPNQSVFTSKAIIFDTNVKLVTIQMLLVPDNAVIKIIKLTSNFYFDF